MSWLVKQHALCWQLTAGHPDLNTRLIPPPRVAADPHPYTRSTIWGFESWRSGTARAVVRGGCIRLIKGVPGGLALDSPFPEEPRAARASDGPLSEDNAEEPRDCEGSLKTPRPSEAWGSGASRRGH
ncbi:unnamed protein product [Gadus morhua 'NCC']